MGNKERMNNRIDKKCSVDCEEMYDEKVFYRIWAKCKYKL